MLHMPLYNLLNTARHNYNALIKSPDDPTVHSFKKFTVAFPCVIVDFMDETYGKYPLSGAGSQILMEYN